MTLNSTLAWNVLDEIRQNPKRWDQFTWIRETPDCGTVACYAGHSLLLSNIPAPKREYLVPLASLPAEIAGCVPTRDRTNAHVRDIANTLLGLDSLIGSVLFSEDNSLEDLQRLTLAIFGERPGTDAVSRETVETGKRVVVRLDMGSVNCYWGSSGIVAERYRSNWIVNFDMVYLDGQPNGWSLSDRARWSFPEHQLVVWA